MSAAVNIRPPECEHCGDTRFISTERLGSVRCPYCRPPTVNRVSAKVLGKLLRASDVRRENVAELSRTIQPDAFKLPNIPNHLLSTDRVLERWGDDGSGLPAENPDAYRASRSPPLDPSTYTEVERIINTAPIRTRRFVYDWWRSSNPNYVTERRGMSRRQIGRTRIDVLHAMKARFLTSRHADLVALIRFLPD